MKFSQILKIMCADHPPEVYKNWMQLTRFALIGKFEGPPIDDIIALIGMDKFRARMNYIMFLLEPYEAAEL